ncbi:MAG TPA: GNAT family protein [Accumulibacter sp.]|jgi:RimJ/RimL family protein N-acetyltransferase|nr:GNAT family protein [Accumulibacter sp.]HQC79375.1 GNAT family protein [Accumulibacter sp.]
MPVVNPLGQTVGDTLVGWQAPAFPSGERLPGRLIDLEPLDVDRHAASLHAANCLDTAGRNWTYLAYGPFATLVDYRQWLTMTCRGTDPLFHAVVERSSGDAVGVAAYLRITPVAGCIEIGHLNFSPRLQRTPAATEALYLLLRHAFALGYRRCEWKCDALNTPSRAAAQRLGLTFEGVFRQATVVKGRNRDTAWYAVIDRDWPACDAAIARWLQPENFDPAGRQIRALSTLIGDVAGREAER